jgi:hypothetical protein
MTIPLRLRCLVLVSFAALAATGCPNPEPPTDSQSLPEGVRADFAVFAQRCSKCHSLSRPLNSGIVDDGYWAMYVARMRRQPGSGISPDDATQILRFLHYYSVEQRQKQERARLEGLTSPATTPLDASTGDAR